MKKIILALILMMSMVTGCATNSETNNETTETTTSTATEEVSESTEEVSEEDENDEVEEAVSNVPQPEAQDFTATHTGTMIINDDMEIKFELYGEEAPITVENFVGLVEEGFYDGLIFHRVIPTFMIQGGDPQGTGMGGSSETITGEFSQNGVDNDILHNRGVISMARAMDMNSASSQFFIMHQKYPSLDTAYAAFGMVTSGIEYVDEIASVQTDSNDKPTTDVIITSITID